MIVKLKENTKWKKISGNIFKEDYKRGWVSTKVELKTGDRIIIKGKSSDGLYYICDSNNKIIFSSGKESNIITPITLEIKYPGFLYFNAEKDSEIIPTLTLLRTRP